MRTNPFAKSIFLISILVIASSASGCQTWFGRGMRHVFLGRKSPSAQAAQVYKNVTPRLVMTDGNRTVIASDPASLALAATRVDPVAMPAEEKPDYRIEVVTRPNDPMARFNLGKEYLEQGRLEEATFQFDMASSLDPTFAESYFMLGRTLRLRGQYDLAIAKLSAATRLDARLAAAYVESGICWDQRGFYSQARERYLAALVINPADAEVFNNLGYSYYLEGDMSAAIKHYKQALGIDPGSVRANSNIAMAYAQKHDYKKCFEHFRRAHGEAVAHNNVGYLLSQEGKFTEAITCYRRSLELNPASVRALLNLETALRTTGQYEEAETVHVRFLQAQKVNVGPTPTAKPGESKPSTEQ